MLIRRDNGSGFHNVVTSNRVDRTVQVLEAFSTDRPQLTLTELQKLTGISLSTLQRIVGSLEESGYIARPDDNRKYELGIAIMERSHIVASQQRLQTEIAIDIVELSASTNASANLAVIQNGLCYLLARIPKPGTHDLRNYAGKSYPPDKTAMGLAIMAWAENRSLQQVMARTYNQTAVNLRDRLEEIRATGYAIDRGGWSPEVYAVAAPIRDFSGAAVGALGIADLISTVDDSREQQLIDMVTQISRRASVRRGWDQGY